MDGASLLVWPEDRAGWSRLTRLLTLGKSRAEPKKGEKGQCFLHWEDVAAWSDDLVAAHVDGVEVCGGELAGAGELAVAPLSDTSRPTMGSGT